MINQAWSMFGFRVSLFRVDFVMIQFKTLVQHKEELTHFCFSLITQEIVGLGCSHEFCEDCWCQYLTIKIADGDADSICCPAEKCDVIVDDVKIMQLVADEKIKQKYQHLMTNSFVQVFGLISKTNLFRSSNNFESIPVQSFVTLVSIAWLYVCDPGESVVGLSTELHLQMWLYLLLQLW